MSAETHSQHDDDFPKEFGELVPWGDPAWYRGYNSPYYGKTHHEWRQRVRQFVEEEIEGNVRKWDEEKKVPKEVYTKMYQAGLLPAIVGAPWPSDFVGEGGPENFDAFHSLIFIEELGRCGSGGVLWAIMGGMGIGLPPVLHFGSDYLKEKVARPCLTGEKFICLAISEPYAGSDVANIRTTAVKDASGDFYVVNGEKKWITNGVFADYFTVAVRTGGPGIGGISLMLLEKSMPGIECVQMDCMGVWPSGTTYITFDNVRVPKENIIGMENAGFMYIMYNFNYERWGIVAQACKLARVCLEEAFKYANKRRTFGKKLVEHGMIKWKLAEMARQVESTHAHLEFITHQLNTIPREEHFTHLDLIMDISLLKVQATKTFEFCAREAAQIFGGASYVRGGQGEKVERLYREVRAFAIPGGSEEIMLDLAVKMAQKKYGQVLKSRL